MIEGEKQAWLDTFRAGDRKFLRSVMLVWRAAISGLPDDPEEDAITAALVVKLRSDPNTRDLFRYYGFQHPPIRSTPQGRVEGYRLRIDLAVIIDQERDTYLAYECKKLNVHGADGARRSQAGAYVRDGMMRFVTEQYGRDLPVGCMLGYVMDGDLQWAYARVVAAMMAQTPTLGLQGRPISAPSIGVIQRFVTQHEHNGRSLEMRHSLLPFVGSASIGAVA